MKQYITEKQLKGLNREGQEKLKRYFRRSTWIFPSILLQLSIGQMIEFLDEHGIDEIVKWNDGWRVAMDWTENGLVEEEELVDALWKAVKEILEK